MVKSLTMPFMSHIFSHFCTHQSILDCHTILFMILISKMLFLILSVYFYYMQLI